MHLITSMIYLVIHSSKTFICVKILQIFILIPHISVNYLHVLVSSCPYSTEELEANSASLQSEDMKLILLSRGK